jgi:hypothetical protein
LRPPRVPGESANTMRLSTGTRSQLSSKTT